MRLLIQRAFLLAGAFALMSSVPVAFAADEEEALEETEVAEEEAEEEAEDDEEVETVIVTGSFIRRETFDLPSPTDTIDELDLEFAGTPDIGDVIFDQTYQIGVNANAAPFEFGSGDDQTEQLGTEVFANLRGLGTRATMTMMDGHRVPANVQGYSFWTRRAGADVTNLYPGVGIGRVETILDGASALYGSEAVSGVVNFIPRKQFDGMEMRYEYQQPIDDGTPSKSFGLVAGAQGERTSAMFAMEIRDEERWKATSRPEFIVASTGWTGQLLPTYNEQDRLQPGHWRVPHRTATGELEAPPLAGWQHFPNPADAPPGFVASSGPWHLYPSNPGQNDYFFPVPEEEQSVRDGRRVYGVTFGYGAAMNDTTGQVRTVNRVDPGCGFDFGAGHNDLGDPSTANEFGLGYNDARKPGNFYNGYMSGNARGIETRTFGDERGSHGAGENCRSAFADWQDARAESNRQSGMGYFEHQFNDYLTLRGELVASSMDYNTRDRAYWIDEWNEGSTFFGPDVAIAIGSNPGNPFRAFADGSNSCDFIPTLRGCDEFSPFILRQDLATRQNNPIPDVYQADTFLTYIDANGNGRYDYLEEAGELLVYAQDSNGDGLPDRDLNGDGVADDNELGNLAGQKNPAYRVLLLSMDTDSDGDGIPDRFDPDSHGNGGVRLFEDVRINRLGAHPKQPYVHESWPWLNPDMSQRRQRAIDNLRMRVGTEIQIPNTEWLVDADWIWARSERTHDYLEPVWTWTVASLRCQGGRPQGGAAPSECWNPFSTAWLDHDPETGEILPAWRDKEHDAWNTELENRRAGLIMRQDQRETDTNIIDVVASNGNLFNLWYNDTSVGWAVGFHFRTEAEEQRPNQIGNASIGSALSTEQKTEEVTQAVFTELQIFPIDHPKLGQMEVQAAIRYAEFEGSASFAEQGQTANFEVTIPKLAVRYQPVDWLAIRGSRTEGFVLPGMFQLFNSADYSNEFGQIGDYLCQTAPDLPHCAAGNINPNNGVVSNVLIRSNAGNIDLSAEVSDLWNVGFSMRFLDGDLNLDIDYTTVDFNGRVERIGAGGVMSSAGQGWESFLLDRCPGTLYDYRNQNRWPSDEFPDIPRNSADYIAQTSQEELQCRASAAREYVQSQETSTVAGAVIERDESLVITEVSDAWINQGEQTATTLIFNGNYNFDSGDIPFIPDDFGSFSLYGSWTRMLELSLERFAVGSNHIYQGIRFDGVGNRNNPWFWGTGSLVFPLPATPENRVNLGLRWFRDAHSLQFGVRWHDSLTDVNSAWDDILNAVRDCRSRIEAGENLTDPLCTNGSVTAINAESGTWNDFNGPLENQHNGKSTFPCDYVTTDASLAVLDCTPDGWTEKEACSDQDRNPYCRIDSRHYWDISYSYTKTDVFGLGFVSFNFSVRNLFDTFPDPMPSGVGYEPYVDSIEGRTAFARLSIGF